MTIKVGQAVSPAHYSLLFHLALLSMSAMAASVGDIAPVLDRRFADVFLNYIVVDIKSRAVLASRWADAETPVPVGSVVKPFLSLAYPGDFPDFECHGARDRCWLAKGHGHVGFREALAQSCNAYFLAMARDVNADALARVAAKYGIAAPEDDRAETRIGLGSGWRIAPLTLVRAYAELASRSAEPRVAQILAGLERAASLGTAAAVGRGALAKTGTAECVAERRHSGDGFTVVLDPAEAPRIAVLVRVHGVPGAEAAKVAARMLRVLRTGR